MSAANTVPNIAIIVLAAGAATRMGKPKQLLPFAGTTLLIHIIDQVSNSYASPVIAVLGANMEIIKPTLLNRPLLIIENQNWSLGIGSSIACAIKSLPTIDKDLQAAIVITGDQPYVTSAIINQLITTYRDSNKPIVCCRYGSTFGVPALFDKQFFPDLAHLDGRNGAKQIIMRHEDKLATIEFAQGAIDIDTPLDYQQVNEQIKQQTERQSKQQLN